MSSILYILLPFLIVLNISIYATIIAKRNYVYNLIIFLEIVTWCSCVYYYIGGETYGKFDLNVILFSVFIWTISSVFLLCFTHISKEKKLKVKKFFIIRYKYFSFSIFILLSIWIIINHRDLLLFRLLTGSDLIRLDAFKTEVRGYYTYYSIVMFNLSYIVYFKFYQNKFKKIPLVYLLIFSFFGLIAGNKSCVVFFFLFLLIVFFTNNKLRIRSFIYLIFLGSFLITSYYFIKESNYFSLSDLLGSSIRRLFITQSSAMIFRFDILLNHNLLNFSINDSRILAREVYSLVYFGEGSMPSPIWGDFLLKYNVFGILLSLFVISIIYSLIRFCYMLERLDVIIIPVMMLWLIQQGGINSIQIYRFMYGLISFFIIISFVNEKKSRLLN